MPLSKAIEAVETIEFVEALSATTEQFKGAPFAFSNMLQPVVLDFFADRLKVQQKEAGVRHDLIDAVFALGGEDNLVRLPPRETELHSFVATAAGTNLLAGQNPPAKT